MQHFARHARRITITPRTSSIALWKRAFAFNLFIYYSFWFAWDKEKIKTFCCTCTFTKWSLSQRRRKFLFQIFFSFTSSECALCWWQIVAKTADVSCMKKWQYERLSTIIRLNSFWQRGIQYRCTRSWHVIRQNRFWNLWISCVTWCSFSSRI